MSPNTSRSFLPRLERSFGCMQERRVSGRMSTDISRPGASVSRLGRDGGLQGLGPDLGLQNVGRQRSLVEDDPDTERIPARTVCAAFSLLVLGLILLCMSANFFARGHPGSLPFFILGVVVIIPGAYSSFQLLAAFRRWPGYDFDDMHGSGDFV